jgi:SecD/SecF fusion protein
MVNDSTNQTLSRTLLTSLTVLLVVIVLYIAGGVAMRGLAFALLVGVATGTYSSIYVAAPILLWLVGKHRVPERSQA